MPIHTTHAYVYHIYIHMIHACHCCFSVAELCLILGDPMDCSLPGSSVFHHLSEFAHNHVHRVSDAI